ncbi:MAG TPA: SLC13 family permease [Erysipelotrichaceae bacterium]|nr:SLC13 family permease [Erysipelotrichaceae bacterium]
MKELALGLFILTYVLLLAFPLKRWLIALASAIVFVVLGILPFSELPQSIDYNVLMMIGGTMGIVALFIESKMPVLMADYILDRTPNVKWAIVALALFAGVISAFVDNVATVLMVAPVALNIALKLKINPIPSIIAIAVSSNLQGAATLVGDTTSILLGGHAGMNFMDFFFMDGKPSIFWAVQLGAVVSTFILLYIFRKESQEVHLEEMQKVEDFFPTFLLLGMIGLLIAASFVQIDFALTNGVICVGLLFIGLVRDSIVRKDVSFVRSTILEIDYQTLILLASLFVIIAGINYVGIVSDISKLFIQVAGDNIFVIYTLIVWASVMLSAFIDNIPYVATMLPVVASLSANLGVDPTLLYFGLLTGATLGGNLSPIGASANIAGIGILRKAGYNPTTKDFMKIGIPFTIAAVVSSYIFVWLIWA